MLLISHRGNLSGPNPKLENSPYYIQQALDKGFNVEVDVWCYEDIFYLGHDFPDYRIEKSFLENEMLWCHAKSPLALEKMLSNPKIHCFWHQNDDFTLTSKGYIWTYPGKMILESRSIAVIPEYHPEVWDISKAYGVCSDFIENYKNDTIKS